MTYPEIFEAYYTLYRAEATIPNDEDDEYTIGIPLANEAINRWANYDNTMWKELFINLSEADSGESVITASTTYEAPDDMRLAGGNIFVRDTDGTHIFTYPIVEPHDAQFTGDNRTYAYFTGDPNNGFTLHLNPIPPENLRGKTLDYIYYKKPTIYTATGGEVTEMSQPYFIVNRMLANRFRASRNPYYSSAKQDAEDVLRTMQLENNSGTWANPWSVADRSGTSWGSER